MVIHHRFLHIRVVWISAGPPSTWKCIQIRVMMCGGVKQMWDPWPFWSFSFALVWFGFFYLFYWVFILQLDGYSFIDWACLETPTQSFSENPFKRVWNLLFLQFSQLLFFWSKWSKLWQTDICRKAKKKIKKKVLKLHAGLNMAGEQKCGVLLVCSTHHPSWAHSPTLQEFWAIWKVLPTNCFLLGKFGVGKRFFSHPT